MAIAIGRNARLFKDDVEIAYGRNITVRASAEAIEVHSMDDDEPALLDTGNVTYDITVERLHVDGAYMTLLLSKTTFTIKFAPTGSPITAPYLTFSNCVVTNVENSAGMTDGILENVSIKAKSMTVTDA